MAGMTVALGWADPLEDGNVEYTLKLSDVWDTIVGSPNVEDFKFRSTAEAYAVTAEAAKRMLEEVTQMRIIAEARKKYTDGTRTLLVLDLIEFDNYAVHERLELDTLDNEHAMYRSIVEWCMECVEPWLTY